MGNSAELTQKQELFLQEYIKCGIGYQAYIKAFPNSKNWKRNSVDVAATKLLNNAKIQQRLSAYNAEVESTLKNSLTLNKRKILEEIVNQYQQASANGGAERTNSVALLKLMAQISKLLDNSNQNNIQVNIQNNTVVGEVTDYLDL